MFQTFEEELGKSIAERLAEHLLGPAALFGLGLVAAWAVAMHGSLLAAWRAWRARPVPEQALGVFLWVVAVVVLAAVMGTLRDFWLRTLEGYTWPGPLRRGLARLWARRARGWKQAWQALKTREMGLDASAAPLSRQERERLASLEVRLRHLPPREDELMPTALGNVLAAAEAAVRHRYGLDPIITWPHLWLVLPEHAREALTQARQGLDRAAEGVPWGLLFAVVAGTWTWWAAPLGLLAAVWAYRLAVTRAAAFGELVRAAFDLHRLALYDALGWPRPSPEEEKEAGKRLTAFLWRGERPSSADR